MIVFVTVIYAAVFVTVGNRFLTANSAILGTLPQRRRETRVDTLQPDLQPVSRGFHCGKDDANAPPPHRPGSRHAGGR